MFGKRAIKINTTLWKKVSRYAAAIGYASPEEFVIHAIEKELTALESADDNEAIQNRLKGLGYIE